MNQHPSTVRKQRRGVSDFGVRSRVSGFGFRVSGAECGVRVMVSGALQVMVPGSMPTI